MSRPFVGAVASVAWEDFGGGGLRRWPFLVEGDLALAGAACSGVRRGREPRQVIRSEILADSVALRWIIM